MVGELLDLEVGPMAHGGHAVARHQGQVVFVRHAIPGERVRAVVTEGGPGDRYIRADAVEIVDAADSRVEPPCPSAGPGRCGGCDFQHIALPEQRVLLGDVVREQLHRLAGLTWDGEVEAVPGDRDGLGWRTRVRYAAGPEREPALRRHRSHDLEPVGRCPLGHRDLPDVRAALADGAETATAVVTSTGETAVVTDRAGAPVVREAAFGHTFAVHAGDFWQVHPGATQVLTEAVLDGLEPRPGEHAWDLYSGVGLFAAVLGDKVGAGGRVVAVEAHRRAARHARANVGPPVRVICAPVDRFVRSRQAQGRLDVVVLDPPRSGAGASVVEGVARHKPRAVAYVACDPAGLARDLATFDSLNYDVVQLRAFDLFPMTHHVECVALLEERR